MNIILFFTSLVDHNLVNIRVQYFAYLFVRLLWLLSVGISILLPIVIYIRITNFFVSWFIFDIDRALSLRHILVRFSLTSYDFVRIFATILILPIFISFWLIFISFWVIIIIIFAWWLERRLPCPGWFQPLFDGYSTVIRLSHLRGVTI